MDGIDAFITKLFSNLISPLVSLLFVLATIIFFIGLIEYLVKADSPEERSKGRQHMLWGIVGLFIMVSANAILSVICNFFAASCDFFLF